MEVKYIVLDDSLSYEDVSGYTGLLPFERQERIARFRFEKDKLRSVIAGLMIIHATGGGRLIYGDKEKPYLADGSMYFSLSHSGDVVAIATDDVEVGCDAELIKGDNRLKIADRFYNINEREYVHSADDEKLAFCRIWTRKEAYLKMTGEGISTDLTAFDTTAEPLSSQIFTKDMDGWCLSVCSEKKIDENEIYISELEIKDLLSI